MAYRASHTYTGDTMQKPIYQALATSVGGRDGHVKTSDGLLDLKVALPKELGGAGGATNPEQLFAAGYAACFHSALQHVAREAKVQLSDSQVSATVGIGKKEGGGFELSAKLAVSAKAPAAAQLKELVDKAHQTCPYSHATRNNMPVELAIKA
jgi:osmotically inducible protein OsmC